MARHGLRWTYGNGDTQHFDYVGRAAAGGGLRPTAARRPALRAAQSHGGEHGAAATATRGVHGAREIGLPLPP